MEGEDDLARERRLIKASLEETISTRKAERKEEAELKRRMDLELIKKRNSEPEGAENPLKLFPKEIWTKILGHLSTAEDVVNARAVCNLFKGILEEKHFGLILMPEVLSMLTFRSRWRAGGKQRPVINCNFFSTAPRLVRLRKVSRAWRQGVDSYFEEGIRDLRWGSMSKDYGGLSVYLYSGPELFPKIKHFLETFSGNQEQEHGTPPWNFFYRYISLVLVYSRYPKAFRSLIRTKAPRLVDAVGSQILRFDVKLRLESIHKVGLSLSQTYIQLRSMIEKMPRIIWLKVGFDTLNGRFNSFSQEEVADLRETIRVHPFPHLSDLRKLILNADVPEIEAETLITTAILEQNLHVNDLEIDANEHRHPLTREAPVLPPITRLGNVDSLTLQSQYIYPSLVLASWPLKKLRIYQCNLSDPVNVHTTFRLLENFPTLQRVQIRLSDVLCRNPGFLRLPQVTYFSYSFQNIWKSNENQDLMTMLSIDFIYFMKKLEFFSWIFDGNPCCLERELKKSGQSWDRENENEIIQFKCGKTNLKDSNIWDLLPSLKTVELRAPFKLNTEVFHRKSDGFVFEPKEKLWFYSDEDLKEVNESSDSSEAPGSGSE